MSKELTEEKRVDDVVKRIVFLTGITNAEAHKLVQMWGLDIVSLVQEANEISILNRMHRSTF